MRSSDHKRMLVTVLLVLAMALLAPGCSDNDGGPTAPEEDPPSSNTPPIPTVNNPQDELPSRSEFLTTETAELRNFSPQLVGASPAMLEELNEAHALDFQLLTGRNVIVQDGRACYPEHLQVRSTTGAWVNFTRATSPAPFVDLGSFGDSHYYLGTVLCIWAFADVSCRNFGGHLASLGSAAEGEFLLNAVQTSAPGVSYHIGLTDWGRPNNDWVWTSGEPVDWTNWKPGEPNNSGGEQFVHVYPDGLWNDEDWGHRYQYVLERSEPLPELDEDDIPCAVHGSSFVYLDELAAPTVVPHVERRVYWVRVFQVTLGSGATYSEEHSYTHGTSETTGMSFGWSIGISTEIGWGPVSVEIETEFHQDFNHEVTVSSEETFTKTYEATAPEGKTMVLALWQLRERFVITGETGEEWSDPRFIVEGPLPELDQGLRQEYLQTILFDQ